MFSANLSAFKNTCKYFINIFIHQCLLLSLHTVLQNEQLDYNLTDRNMPLAFYLPIEIQLINCKYVIYMFVK